MTINKNDESKKNDGENVTPKSSIDSFESLEKQLDVLVEIYGNLIDSKLSFLNDYDSSDQIHRRRIRSHIRELKYMETSVSRLFSDILEDIRRTP